MIVSDGVTRFHTRPGREDHLILTEHQYRRVLVGPDVFWADVGAHIGAFSCRVAPHCKGVFAFEPDLRNFSLLEMNQTLNQLPNLFLLNAAVGSGRPSQGTLRCGRSGFGSSLQKTSRLPGQPVEVVDIEEVLAGEVNALKLDCEGCEMEVLLEADLSRLLDLHCEYHFPVLKDKSKAQYRKILARLREHFQEVVAPEPDALSHERWHAQIFATNRPGGERLDLRPLRASVQVLKEVAAM